MAGLIKTIEDKCEDKCTNKWSVTIQGTTWSGFASETDHVTNDKMQPDSGYFKGLILVEAFYHYGFMDNDNMDYNISRLANNIARRFNLTPYFEDRDDMYNTAHDFVCEWIPYTDNGYSRDYPCDDGIDIDIKDSKGKKYELDYTENDVIDALKIYKLAK